MPEEESARKANSLKKQAGRGRRLKPGQHSITLHSTQRNNTKSPVRSNYFYTQQQAAKLETVESRLAKIPLEEDSDFLKAIKAELIGLQRRIRHETL